MPTTVQYGLAVLDMYGTRLCYMYLDPSAFHSDGVPVIKPYSTGLACNEYYYFEVVNSKDQAKSIMRFCSKMVYGFKTVVEVLGGADSGSRYEFDMHGNLLSSTKYASSKQSRLTNPMLAYYNEYAPPTRFVGVDKDKLNVQSLVDTTYVSTAGDFVTYSIGDATATLKLYDIVTNNKSRGKDTVMGKLERLKALEAQEAARMRVEAEIEELRAWKDSLPEEPEVDAVVSFERTYEENGKKYSFVAYQAVKGKWYLSQDGLYGARKPAMSWLELLDFVGDEPMWFASSWEQLK